MSDNQVQRGWEERVISNEKGNRIVHYLIKDTTGVSILAVVGVEKSIRHMTYQVTEDFLRVFGSASTIHAGTRWKSRAKVIECLVSAVLGNGPIFADSYQRIIDSTPHLKDLIAMMTRLSRRRSEQAQNSRQSEGAVVWSGESWTCDKHVKHYPAFIRSDTKISVYSFVWIRSAKYFYDFVGYVEDMYEDQRREKMVRVRWFSTREEIEGHFAELEPECREIFITPKEDDISAESIDGIAAVLTPSDFKKCEDYLPQALSIQNLMCHRELKEKQVRPFSLSSLRGYSTQPILYSLQREVFRRSNKKEKSTQQVEASRAHGPAVQVPRRSRSIRVDVAGRPTTPVSDHITKPEPSGPRIRINASGKKPADDVPAEQQGQPQQPKAVENKIEFLSQDSSLRGCWFRCKILRSTEKKLKVQYYDVQDVDGPAKLEEWIPASRVADPDTLKVRCDGRLTVRPWPDWDSSEVTFEVGAAMDAWWNDGWWEGVVIGRDTTATNKLQVYLPGEKYFVTIERRNIRVSQDWIDNKWVSLRAKTDILSYLSSLFDPAARLPLPALTDQQANIPAAPAPSSSRPRDGKGKAPVSSSSPKAVNELNLKKQLTIRENEGRSSGRGAAGKDATRSKSGSRSSSGSQPKSGDK